MIKFKGQTIKCGSHHSTLQMTPGDLVAQTTYFWGLNGTSEIVSGVSHAIVEADAWLNDNWVQAGGLAALIAYLQNDLHGLRGKNGPLIESGTVNRTWKEATFLGFQTTALPGQERPSPVQLVDTEEWVQAVTLRWRALKGN